MVGCTCEVFGLDCCCCYGEYVVVDVVDVVVVLCNVLGDEKGFVKCCEDFEMGT